MAAGMATRSGRPLPGQDLHLPEQRAFARHTEWTKHPIEIDVGETRTIRAGDFDADGDPDLLGMESRRTSTTTGTLTSSWRWEPGDPCTRGTS